MIPALRRLAAQPGSFLLPLRGFLGVTFVFAGLQKLANPAFFRGTTPTSIQQQLADVRATSPIGFLVALGQHVPVLLGALISLGELAVGMLTLAGLLTRAAAAGGLLVSLSFFLTVSWRTSPYYYGADIVFAFAWVTLALHGPTPLSLDESLAQRRAAALAQVEGADPAAQRQEIDRRSAISRGLLGAGAAVATLFVGGLTALIGRSLSPPGGRVATGTSGPTLGTGGGAGTTGAGTTGGGPTGGGTGTTGTGTKPKGARIGPASAVPVGGAASFNDPANGLPAYVVQPTAGTYRAFSAVCTHEGCTVGFVRGSGTFDCPCHGSIFDARTGAVLQGPAASGLPAIPLEEAGGQLYVT